MKLREIEHMLEHAGFVLVRSGKHKVYKNGMITIIIPHSRVVNPFIVKDIMKKINHSQMKVAA